MNFWLVKYVTFTPSSKVIVGELLFGKREGTRERYRQALFTKQASSNSSVHHYLIALDLTQVYPLKSNMSLSLIGFLQDPPPHTHFPPASISGLLMY